MWSRILNRRAFVSVIVLLVAMTVSSCMMVRGGTLQPPTTWPPTGGSAASEKKAVNLWVTAKILSGGSERPGPPKQQQVFEGQSQKAYMESGLFSQVQVSQEPAELRADIEVTEEGNMALAGISGFISGFTMGIIPGYAKENVIMVTVFRDRNGKELASIRKAETLSFWIQVFLVAAMPFREEPSETAKRVFYDLNRTTIDEARAQGILY